MIETPCKKEQHEANFQHYSRNSSTSRKFLGPLGKSTLGNKERRESAQRAGLARLQTTYGMVITRPALMHPTPARPGQNAACRGGRGPDEPGQQMAYFRTGQGKQDRLRRGSGLTGRASL